MKQILQNLKTGKTELTEIPFPQLNPGHFLIQSRLSLISSGTERMLVEFGKASYLAKAKKQPEKVKQVLDKIKTDGMIPTIETVQSKLDQPLPLGYNNVGTVVQIENPKVTAQSLRVGDRVVSNGPHAEVVCVPRNLCGKIPDKVSNEEAAFTIVGAIGLQGIRLAQPTLGELFVVTGLGLIGQLTLQLLMAHGCRVIGIDYDSTKCKLAKNFGAKVVDLSKGEDPVESGMTFTQGNGVDGVIITAATKSSEPIHQAAQMCRKHGRIILVGVTGLDIRRSDFQNKELTFQVSNSYGPGRYDPQYEEKGHDYPLGYVRWTAQRNFQAFLHLLGTGKLDVKPLITHRFPFEEAPKAYDLISKDNEKYLGIILSYKKPDSTKDAKTQKREEDPQITQTLQEDEKVRRLEGKRTEDGGQRSDDRSQKTEVGSERTVRLKEPMLKTSNLKLETSSPVIGLIGAGNFTGQVLLPALQKTNARLKVIASSGGVTGTHLGKKFGFEESTTDVERIFADSEINTVFVTTRHNSHASFVLKALESGNHVFVEKPLCLDKEDLHKIINTYKTVKTHQPEIKLMVGFNRRFSPHVVKIKEILKTVDEPKSIIMTVNAGMLPIDHWTQDAEVGGGRILGESCHYIDLIRFLTETKIETCNITSLNNQTKDTATINILFEDGSIGSIHYFSNGSKKFPKERLEIFCSGKILQLNNFKILRGFGWKKFKKLKLWKQDKGHYNEIQAFVESIIQGKPNPIPFEEIVEVMKTTLQIAF